MSRGTSRSLFFVLLVIVACGFLGSAAFSQRGNPAYPTGASDNDVRDSLRQFLKFVQETTRSSSSNENGYFQLLK